LLEPGFIRAVFIRVIPWIALFSARAASPDSDVLIDRGNGNFFVNGRALPSLTGDARFLDVIPQKQIRIP
jgi:hypothetical protein